MATDVLCGETIAFDTGRGAFMGGGNLMGTESPRGEADPCMTGGGDFMGGAVPLG